MDAIEEVNTKLKETWQLCKELIDDGYENCGHSHGDIPVFRKRIMIDGKPHGKWKAILDGKIIDITYEQALGREAIRPIDKLAMFLGSKLLRR